MMMQQKIDNSKILLEALPYIKQFSGKTVVIKYGGSLMVDDELKDKFALNIVLLKYVGMNPIIVHGGGKEISKWLSKVGKETVFIDGLRVTDSETMEITEMVLSGKINSELVTLINSAGGKAVGLSGKDADLFHARKIKSRTNQDLGFVGSVDRVDVQLLDVLTRSGYIPVISSVGRSMDGESFNLNADHVASEIAIQTEALKLIYLTDVNGIQTDGQFNAQLSLADAQALIQHPDIKGGMIPKLDCSISALENGVDRVHIINGSTENAVLLEMFTDDGIGTMIKRKS